MKNNKRILTVFYSIKNCFLRKLVSVLNFSLFPNLTLHLIDTLRHELTEIYQDYPPTQQGDGDFICLEFTYLRIILLFFLDYCTIYFIYHKPKYLVIGYVAVYLNRKD